MPSATRRKRRTFGNTWWGAAWVEALEERAKLDPNRLPRGRTYARKGSVSKLAVAVGEVTARVQGSRAVPYRVTIHMRAFTEEQWENLLGMVGSRLGHVAALLDGELPGELAEDARATGADLLPGPGDLRPKCSCPDSANPCKHVAAVYYLVADEVDADPFVLFLLRGRPREAVLAELRARRAPAKAPGKRVRAPAAPGVDPKRAYTRRIAALPPRLAVPGTVGPPAVLDVDPPHRTGWSSDTFAELAADAAARAWELLVMGPEHAVELSFEEDLARRAAAASVDEVADFADAAQVPARDLAVWAQAWREAGRGGMAVVRDVWKPGPAPLAQARADLAESGLPGEPKTWRNRITQGDLQLRYGQDERWYRFVRDGEGWRLDGPPSARPTDVIYPA
ncbi:SWIM zinc finger family protein [Amycolatopsis sp. lyj-112]|uniref:SWIM zinc finger family protein n=1 Tax=Amycolatopsis sp. lyj-112 TaxID=2789288 RepID=UPI00397B0A57